MKILAIILGGMGSLLGAVAVQADGGGRPWAPGQWAQAVHPAAETNYFLFRDIYDRSEVPEVKAKNPMNCRPVGFRFGPQTNDIAFLIFAGRKGITELPDEMFLYIPGHKQFNTPKGFRGRQAGIREAPMMAFDKVAFTIESSGFTRNIQGEIRHGWKCPGYIGMDLTVTTTVGKQKASMLVHMKEEHEDTGLPDKNKFRTFSLLGAPKLNLRAYGDGTELSATVVIHSGWNTLWFILPLEGMEKEIAVTLVDESGKVAETTKMTTTPKTFNKLEGWTGKLKNVKQDQRYTVRAKINLGPSWYGDITAEVKTFLVPKSL
jgi:hypothetical protein